MKVIPATERAPDLPTCFSPLPQPSLCDSESITEFLSKTRSAAAPGSPPHLGARENTYVAALAPRAHLVNTLPPLRWVAGQVLLWAKNHQFKRRSLRERPCSLPTTARGKRSGLVATFSTPVQSQAQNPRCKDTESHMNLLIFSKNRLDSTRRKVGIIIIHSTFLKKQIQNTEKVTLNFPHFFC